METLKRKVEELIDEINIAEDIDEETHKKLNMAIYSHYAVFLE